VAVPTASLHTSITANSIDLNGGFGIDLGTKGVTPSASGFQSFPTLTAVTTSGGSAHITGSLNSPGGTYNIDLYDSPDCDQSGFGEGRTFLGTTTVTTDATGSGTFIANVSGVAGGDVITATATSPNGDTSEFSSCFVDVAAPVGSISIAADASTVPA